MTTLAALSTIFISILGYAILGFVTASLNQFLFDPSDAETVFICCFLTWPIVLPIDIIGLSYRVCSKLFSLKQWIRYLQRLRHNSDRGRLFKARKDITA